VITAGDVINSNVEAFRALFVDWFRKLARDAELPLDQSGGSSDEAFTLGAPDGLHITATFVPEYPFLRFASNDPGREALVQELVRHAASRAEAADFGGIVWYSTALVAPAFQLSPLGLGTFFEQLGNQARINGWRRLGGSILLEFKEQLPADWKEGATPLAPETIVHVHLAVPAPSDGYFSSALAHPAMETVGAICTFALMREVQLPLLAIPSKPESVPELIARQVDPSVLTLARRGVPLDIFGFTGMDALDVYARLRAALLTFNAAKQQRHDLVACVLYVVVAESLVTPHANWRELKTTTRFIRFYDELMPSVIDELVAHRNLEALFPMKRGAKNAPRLRRELLTHIYDFRSGFVHQGLQPNYRGHGSSARIVDDVRRSFFSEFAERAILEFIKSPRCSIVGHPAGSKPESEGETEPCAAGASGSEKGRVEN
jgi:hypothetical protein